MNSVLESAALLLIGLMLVVPAAAWIFVRFTQGLEIQSRLDAACLEEGQSRGEVMDAVRRNGPSPSLREETLRLARRYLEILVFFNRLSWFLAGMVVLYLIFSA